MSEPGYAIVSLDELGRYRSPTQGGGEPALLPLRRRLGLRAFGANCWTAEPGQRLIPEHIEDSGHEELYVVVRGHARFEVGGETIDAPAGTLVHVLAGARRTAFSQAADTLVFVAGAAPGEPFEAHGWEDIVVAFGEAERGNLEAGRAVLEGMTVPQEYAWGHAYNQACFEARFGDRDAAFDHLRYAFALQRDEALALAPGDSDLDALRDDPRWAEIVK